MTDTVPDTKAHAKWLATAIAPWKRAATLTTVLNIADVIPAIGFAAGLGLSLGALVQAVPWDHPTALGYYAAFAMALPGALLAIASLLLRAVISYFATTVAAKAARQSKTGLRQTLLGGLFSGRLSDSYAIAAAVEGIDTLEGHVSRFTPARKAAAIAPLLLILAAAVVSPFSAGILVFTLTPFIVGMILTGMAAASESRKHFVAMERLSGLFTDRVRSLPAILAFQAEGTETRRIHRSAQELAHRTSKVLKVAFLSTAILEFFSALAVALVAVYCGFNLLRILPFPAPDMLTLGQAFFLLALAPEVYQPMRRLAAAYHDRQAAEAAVPHLQALSEAVPQTLKPAPAMAAQAPAISYRNVSIAYVEACPVISDFNLEAKAGSTTVLVGPSGSGKSSLMHLLLGMAPLSGGEVRIGDHLFDGQTDFSPWIAYAGQAPIVILGTLADNIALANPEATTRQIFEAASMAGLYGDMDRKIDERGGGLSGGERRRLGLARAFLKPAPVLMLDEPTAHLDHASEQALLPIIRKAAEGRTTLIATHSDAVAALADTVIQL